MNRLTSQQRKLVYLGGIFLLMALIIWLGMPASGDDSGRGGQGGKLAQMRQQYDLGESTLGEVDPASATMNLVLLGLRGPASTVLAMELDKQKDRKQWADMRATVESIIRLQPHFAKVWEYQGHNLAYNVSSQWDAISDRYYWVKEGGKFLMRGSQRNARVPDLHWWVGNVLSKKVGRSDEWQFFRGYFLNDPDTEQFGGGPDPGFNEKGQDNYLAAKDWFHIANDVERDYRQRIMMQMLFRAYPARAQFDYADALQREGIFGERTQLGWEEAFEDWTREYRSGIGTGREGYGRETFQFVPRHGGQIRLESTLDDLRELAKADGLSLEEKQYWTGHYRNVSNYDYWRLRAMAEREQNTVEAHREIYEGQQLFKNGSLRQAREMLESGMAKYAGMLGRHPALSEEFQAMEEGLMALLYWRYTLQLLGEAPPDDYPLKPLWMSQAELPQQGQIPELDARFRRENGIGLD